MKSLIFHSSIPIYVNLDRKMSDDFKSRTPQCLPETMELTTIQKEQWSCQMKEMENGSMMEN
jgi:hypothetical protein